MQGLRRFVAGPVDIAAGVVCTTHGNAAAAGVGYASHGNAAAPACGTQVPRYYWTVPDELHIRAGAR